MTQGICFLAPLPALRKRTRLAKMATILTAGGYHIDFAGWERLPGEAQTFAWEGTGVQETTILRRGGYASGKARALYPVWMWRVFRHVLKLGRGRPFFCLGWETAFPALLAAKFTGARIVFDDADRFSMIVRLPEPAGALLRSLERWASRRAALHVIPGFARYDWRHDRMIVLRNSPLSSDFKAALAAPPQRPAAQVVLYANGWIGQTRGAPIFLALLEQARAEGVDLRLVVAGRVDGAAAAQLMSDPAVLFLGELPQRTALAWYAVADAVLTYYNPDVAINRQAESNKWGDAVFFGCPIIVNSEVETAKPLIDQGAAHAVPYNDVKGLLRIAVTLAKDSEQRARTTSALKAFLPEYPVFDLQLNQILAAITSASEDVHAKHTQHPAHD